MEKKIRFKKVIENAYKHSKVLKFDDEYYNWFEKNKNE